MKKPAVSTFVALAVLMVFMVAAGVARADAPIVNRDFETGDLAGWTQFTTTNGAMAGGSFLAVFFDVVQGTASRAVQFVVGQDGTSGLGQEGGGIFQDVDLETGVLTMSADIGVRRVAGADGGGGFNGQAGIFQLLVDGVVVDTHDFGAISFSGETKYDSLTAALSNVSSGTHEIRFLITRAGLPDTLLGQYIDNVAVSVSANGLALSTEAGNGTAGFDDAVVAIGSTLDLPLGVASYAVGNLFIADALNHRIRRMDVSTGIITTVAGNGVRGYLGDGVVATTTQLNAPNGVAVDAAGNLFIADSGNHRIRRVDAGTNFISTVAGNGTRGEGGEGGPATSAELFIPADVAVDVSGNLFIAGPFKNRILRVDAGTGTSPRPSPTCMSRDIYIWTSSPPT